MQHNKSPYKNKEEFEKILSMLWDRILQTPKIVESVSGVKLVAKFRYTDFPSALYIDISGESPRYFWNPEKEVQADVEMILSSETSHKFWMEDLNVPMAIASRKIIPKGSVQKALKLIPALKPAFAMYPQVLQDMGRHDLLVRPPKRMRRPLFEPLLRFFPFKKKGRMDPSQFPVFPMEFEEGKGKPPAPKTTKPLEKATDKDLLHTMCVIRAFEEHLSLAFRQGDLPTEEIGRAHV
jgi:2-oxoisovalerate dehydrogenase E1 component